MCAPTMYSTKEIWQPILVRFARLKGYIPIDTRDFSSNSLWRVKNRQIWAHKIGTADFLHKIALTLEALRVIF